MLTEEKERIYQRSIEYAAKVNRDEGRAEGRAEGEAKGRTDSKLEVAKAMKADGVDVNVIVKYTGLTEEQIKEL